MSLFGRSEDFSRFATHEDLQRLEERLNIRIERLDTRIDQSEERLRGEIRHSEANTTRWMVGTSIVTIGVVVSVVVALFGQLISVLLQVLPHLPANPPPGTPIS